MFYGIWFLTGNAVRGFFPFEEVRVGNVGVSYSESCEDNFLFSCYFVVGVFSYLFFNSIKLVVGGIVPNALPFVPCVYINVLLEVCVWKFEAIVYWIIVGNFCCCVCKIKVRTPRFLKISKGFGILKLISYLCFSIFNHMTFIKYAIIPME